jgi:predicted phosphodiesterase
VGVDSAEIVTRVAALADVHGNAPALASVLEEVVREAPDLVVFCGDLTWGSLPRETLDLVHGLRIPARFVRGNADRVLVELRDDVVESPTDREQWMLAQHSAEALAFLATFEPTVTVDVDGLGRVCFSHGSPRSDEECVTERTPAERVGEFSEGVDADVIVTAHIHVQYDRRVAGLRLMSPGSVGLPYEGRQGAYWALLGPDVELRRTDYDVAATTERMRATDDPRVEVIVEMMLEPPSREEAVEHAERVVFSG